MLSLLQSNLSLVAGVLLIALVAAVRMATADPLFRRDLGGALVLLVAHLALRALNRLLPEASPLFHRVVAVGWMLALAWGAIRVAVALGLKFARMRRRETPKILRDVLDTTLYALCAVPILKRELNFDLTSVVATSAVLSLVIGLALQETLGNLFAGLSLQLEEPFQVGDWVTIGQHTGRVINIAWRTTRIETASRKVITLPNNMVAKEAVQCFIRGEQPFGVEHSIGLAYEAPPNLVKEVLLEVLGQIHGVVNEPAEPTVRVAAYEDSAIRYHLRYFVLPAVGGEVVRDELFTRLWYRLKREGIDIPFPQRALHMLPPAAPVFAEEELSALLREVDLFAPFDEDTLFRLRAGLKVRHFGKGETILREGAEGNTFYLVARGEVSVRAARSGAEVSRLERGQYFGEMSLLTGEPRAATVVAGTDVVLFEVDRPLFADLFRTHPELARLLSAILAQRRSQLRAAASAGGPAPDPVPEATRIFTRLRHIFRLRE